MMPEIAMTILFLTIEKCNRDCNVGSFLGLHSETSPEFNAGRENYGEKKLLASNTR